MNLNKPFAAPTGSTKRLFILSLFLCLLSMGKSLAQPCPPPVFISPPTNITVYTGPNTCSPLVNFLARVLDSTGVSFKFLFSGATATNGTGTGSGLSFNRGVTHVVVTASKGCDSAKIAFDIKVLDTIKPKLTIIPNITAYAGPNQCGANVPYHVSVTDNCPDCSHNLLLALGFKLLGNFQGHSYYTTPLKTNFDVVNTQASTFGSHLVSINSHAEDSFIAAVLPDTQLAWIGFTDRDVEGVWKWTDGSPVTYTNWCDFQPDDFYGNQDWAILNSGGLSGPVGCWDDAHSPIFPGNGQPNNFVGIVELDQCGTSLVRTRGLDSGGFFPIGTTVVAYTATDAFGNVDSIAFNVTVLDTIKPTLTTVPDIIAYAGPNQCCAPVSYRRPTVTDNCPGCNFDLLTLLGFKLLGTFGGHYYFTTPAKTDFNTANAQAFSIVSSHLVSINSMAEDSFIAAVLPDTQLAWIGFTDRDTEGIFKWTDGSPTTYTNFCVGQPDDFLGDQDWVVLNSVVPNQTGRCWDDSHSPIFKGNGKPNLFVGIVELDRCGPIVVRIRGLDSGDCFPVGVTVVDYKARDAFGNETVMSFKVTVIDTFKPKLVAPNITAYAGPNQCCANVPYKVTVTDNCPNCSFNVLNALGFKLLGIFQGHSYFTTPSKSSFDSVNSQALSVIASHLVSINSHAEDSFIAAVLPDTQLAWIGFTDRDVEGVWKWTDGSPVTYTNWCNSQPDDFLGDQDWAILNSGGLSGPVGCWDDSHSPIFKGNGQPNNFVGIVELDICGTSLVKISGIDSGGCFPVGTSTVKYKAVDAFGNLDSISFTVTVIDTVKPKISPIANITAYAGPNQCGAIVPYNVTVSDNCPGCSNTLLFALGFKLLGSFQGHSYFTTPLKSNFDNVNAQAFTIVSAHLVSINSHAEDSFIAAVLPDTQLAWIGFTDRDVEGVFKWTDGSPVTYTNWCTTEPDDFLGDQDWVILNSAGLPGAVGCWDDAHSPIFKGNGQPNNFVGIVELDSCRTPLLRTKGLAGGSLFPVGTTVVQFKSSDAYGNVDSMSFNVTVLDTVKPVIICPKDTTVSCTSATDTSVTGKAKATDNCAVSNIKFKDSVSLGLICRVWTATDVNGNVATCKQKITIAGPVCSIVVVPANMTNTGGVATNIYLGYGPQSATIMANGPCLIATYTWTGPTALLSCTNCKSPVFTPTTAGNYTFTVKVNCNGCVSTCSVTFCVKDIRVANSNPPLIWLCDAPSSNIQVSNVMAMLHLMMHPNDVLGKCGQLCGTSARIIGGSEEEVVASEIRIYPNPTTQTFVVELPYFEKSASVTVMDMQGKLLQSRKINETDGHKLFFDLGGYARGMYMVDVIYGDQRYRAKVVLE